MFYKVLATTDRVTFCDAAVSAGAMIARQNHAELHIVHIAESAAAIDREFIKHFRTGEEIVYNEEYGQTVRAEIEKACAHVLGADIDYKIHVMPGFPWMMILKTARKQRSDLILMGPHTTRAQDMGVLRVSRRISNTVQEVIRHERCPVMLVNQPVSEDRLTFGKIVIGTNFSKSCENALLFAIDVAKKKDSELVVFHMASGTTAAQSAQAKDQLEAFCRSIPGEIRYETRMWAGVSPHAEILKCANEKGADLIVMGSHTKEKESRWYVGSAVEGVSAHSDCPVCVITDPKVLLPLRNQ